MATSVVARNTADKLEFLAFEDARPTWTAASQRAERFQNVREATRAAMRLPSRFRAFALPVHA